MVNSAKLKIILTKNDMKKLDISCDSLDYASYTTRSAIGQILDKARSETGFTADGESLYIQAFPSTDGGCELFFTKSASLLSRRSDRNAEKYPINSHTAKKHLVAATDSLECLIALAVRMKTDGFRNTSALYSNGKDYFLVVGFHKRTPVFSAFCEKDIAEPDHGFMSEYADVFVATDIQTEYIYEHMQKIIGKRAVETLAEKFGD